ncbi:MAG TPA: hypothetical protein VE569_07300 [Acidimicrobiia bacterium]|jgi:hypothetical protein|nr:hypothetical protein [Acidimicrobiia bacterium]
MSQSRRRIIGSLLFAVLWAVVAAVRPTTTFHLASLIVAIWAPLGERQRERALAMSLAGGLIAAVTTGLLSLAGWLQGPSLLPWGGAGFEALVGAAAGSLIGVVPALFTPAATHH